MKFRTSYVGAQYKYLKPLGEVLDQWLVLNDRYYNHYEDIVSCYQELTCVSHLNAAAWCCSKERWMGLQEYHAEKTDTKNGRIDLHLYDREKEKGYAIEAKREFIDIANEHSDNFIATLMKRSKRSMDSAKKVISKRGTDIDYVLAATFFDFQTEYGKGSRKKDSILNLLEPLISKIEETKPFHAGAYWFPDKPIFQNGWAYCGTFLAIQGCK